MDWKTQTRRNDRGQILVEGLVLMMFLTSVIVVIINFTKKQEEVLKRYELPAKIRAQKNR